MKTITKKTYGLRSRFTGGLARLIVDRVVEYGDDILRYRLAMPNDSEAEMTFEVDTQEMAAMVKVFDAPEETSTISFPSWGVLDMAEFEVAEITRVTTCEVAPLPTQAPVVFDRLIGQRSTHGGFADHYLQRRISVTLRMQGLSFGVAPIPAGETFESLRAKCDGRLILIGGEDAHPEMCVGVGALPDEYVDLFTVEQGVGLIMTRAQD